MRMTVSAPALSFDLRNLHTDCTGGNMKITDEELWEVAKSFDDLIECTGGYYRHHGHYMDRTKAIKILRQLLEKVKSTRC
jgi:hypothetical protein